jgi:hypothetical protein
LVQDISHSLVRIYDNAEDTEPSSAESKIAELEAKMDERFASLEAKVDERLAFMEEALSRIAQALESKQ